MLKKHEQSDHKESGDYNCNKCDKIFNGKETLSQHKRSDHQKEEHRCDLCNEKFDATERLEQHKKACHKDTKYQQHGK